jgi:hypothetical protein
MDRLGFDQFIPSFSRAVESTADENQARGHDTTK